MSKFDQTKSVEKSVEIRGEIREFPTTLPTLVVAGGVKTRGGSLNGRDFGQDVAKQGGISLTGGNFSRNSTDYRLEVRGPPPPQRRLRVYCAMTLGCKYGFLALSTLGPLLV